MKITIESTNTVIPGMGRVWNGVAGNGVSCQVVVALIGSQNDADLQAILPELKELLTLGTTELGELRIHTPDKNPS